MVHAIGNYVPQILILSYSLVTEVKHNFIQLYTLFTFAIYQMIMHSHQFINVTFCSLLADMKRCGLERIFSLWEHMNIFNEQKVAHQVALKSVCITCLIDHQVVRLLSKQV